MGAKSKSANKKKKISKHVLNSRAAKGGDQTTIKAGKSQTDEEGASDPPKASAPTPATGKQKQRKNRHVKDPSEAAAYLEQWKASKDGKPGWKFNKNTQSWLIRHMYEAEKIPKGIFSLLLDYLGGLEGNATRSWIRSEASRRALRYKNFEKNTNEKNDRAAEGADDYTMKEVKANNDGKSVSEEEREDEVRWKQLSGHDKRKEYKRARKILEVIKE